MQCRGCLRETDRRRTVNWPNGTTRGTFCEDCYAWITNGRLEWPIVLVDTSLAQIGGTKRETRTYRNDSTDELYELARCTQGPRSHFSAYGPARAEIELAEIENPIPIHGETEWGRNYSWAKAERTLYKLLANR